MRHLLLAFAAAAALAAPPARAQTVVVLHSFTGPDGIIPGQVAADAGGTVYGATLGGGLHNLGTVYSVAPDGTTSDIHDFVPNEGAGDGGVSVYASTLFGVAPYNYGRNNGTKTGYGLVFSIPKAGGGFTVLHRFSGRDGAYPSVAPVLAPSGILFGVTFSGGLGKHCLGKGQGALQDGVIYSIAAGGKFVTDYAFSGCDGAQPNAILADTAGNLYGTTSQGGPENEGTLWEYTPSTGVLSTLYSFTFEANAVVPVLGAIGPDGSLYGAANSDSPPTKNGYGNIWTWSQTGGFRILHTFNGADGALPAAPVLSKDGLTLYGSTEEMIVNNQSMPVSSVFSLVIGGPLSILATLPGAPGASSASNPVVITPTGLAGASNYGGTGSCAGQPGFFGPGCGTVYTVASPAP